MHTCQRDSWVKKSGNYNSVVVLLNFLLHMLSGVQLLQSIYLGCLFFQISKILIVALPKDTEDLALLFWHASLDNR